MKYSLSIIIGLSIFASCALLDSARAPLNRDQKSSMVPRSEYDQLMKKHVELSKKYQAAAKAQSENEGEPGRSDFDANIDSVDVFAEVNKVQKISPPPQVGQSGTEPSNEFDLIRRAIFLKSSGKVDQALKIFQALEISTTIQVKVRAKFFIGEILLEKKQYDLAMQSFESIINNYAFSGMVIGSLRHLVTCADQLGIVDKKQKYLLMLKDVFDTV